MSPLKPNVYKLGCLEGREFEPTEPLASKRRWFKL